jgi:hypothetical protein
MMDTDINIQGMLQLLLDKQVNFKLVVVNGLITVSFGDDQKGFTSNIVADQFSDALPQIKAQAIIKIAEKIQIVPEVIVTEAGQDGTPI